MSPFPRIGCLLATHGGAGFTIFPPLIIQIKPARFSDNPITESSMYAFRLDSGLVASLKDLPWMRDD